MAKRGDLTEGQIIELVDGCAANGAELLEEAQVLYSKGHYPRAYVLAQLAGEECAKAHLLLSLLMLKLAGVTPPMKSFWSWWVNHDDKSMFQESWDELLSRPEVRDWMDLPPAAANASAPEWIEGLAASLVLAKGRAPSGSSRREDATYVDFRNGEVYLPKQQIDEVLAQGKIAQVAAEVGRAKEISNANLAALIQISEAVEFLRAMVAAMGQRVDAVTKPTEL